MPVYNNEKPIEASKLNYVCPLHGDIRNKTIRVIQGTHGKQEFCYACLTGYWQSQGITAIAF